MEKTQTITDEKKKREEERRRRLQAYQDAFVRKK